MMAPLMDDKGRVKYFIGCQVDVTGLVEEGRGVESFRSLLNANTEAPSHRLSRKPNGLLKDTAPSKPLQVLKELSQMFSRDEAEVIKQNIRESDQSDTMSIRADSKYGYKDDEPVRQPRRIIGAELPDHDSGMAHISSQFSAGGFESATAYPNVPNLPGVYKHVSSIPFDDNTPSIVN